RVELRPMDRHVRARRHPDLVINFADGSRNHVSPGNHLVRAEDILGLVVAIDVSRYEVEGQIVLHAVIDESAYPGGLRRGRPSDAETGAHTFEGSSANGVEPVVRFFFRLAGPEV